MSEHYDSRESEVSEDTERDEVSDEISEEVSDFEDYRPGRVKWFDPRKGYGFVTEELTGEDFFVHHSGIVVKRNVYKSLTEGEPVEFRVEPDDEGRDCAVGVRGINSGPLMCETDTIQRAFRRGYSVGQRMRRDSRQGEDRRREDRGGSRGRRNSRQGEDRRRGRGGSSGRRDSRRGEDRRRRRGGSDGRRDSRQGEDRRDRSGRRYGRRERA